MRKELYKFPPIFCTRLFSLAYVTEVCLLPKAPSTYSAEETEYLPPWGTPGIPACDVCGGRAGRVRGRTGSGAPHPADSARPGPARTPRPRLHSLCRAGPVHGGSIRSGVQLDRPGLLLRHLRPHTARRGADGAAAAPLRTGPRDFLRRGKLWGELPCPAVPPRAAGR